MNGCSLVCPQFLSAEALSAVWQCCTRMFSCETAPVLTGLQLQLMMGHIFISEFAAAASLLCSLVQEAFG